MKKVVADRTSKRIEFLVQEYLQKLAINPDLWETLYQDPNDERLWVLYYPQSEMHGGGPPALKHISKNEAQTKFSYS